LARMHHFSVESVQCIEKEQMEKDYHSNVLQEPLFVPFGGLDVSIPYAPVGDITTLPLDYKDVITSQTIEPEYIKSVDDLFQNRKECG